jgi:hypothetical protein
LGVQEDDDDSEDEENDEDEASSEKKEEKQAKQKKQQPGFDIALSTIFYWSVIRIHSLAFEPLLSVSLAPNDNNPQGHLPGWSRVVQDGVRPLQAGRALGQVSAHLASLPAEVSDRQAHHDHRK